MSVRIQLQTEHKKKRWRSCYCLQLDSLQFEPRMAVVGKSPEENAHYRDAVWAAGINEWVRCGWGSNKCWNRGE